MAHRIPPSSVLATCIALSALLTTACRSGDEAEDKATALPATPWTAGAIAHGGVGSPPERADGCRAAVDAALEELAESGDPLGAAVAGVQVMEDDPRFNAGTGSRLRIDGETVQMDAAVMDSKGRYGAVAVVEHVRYPVAVAQAVLDTPHLLLAGDGATALARARGMPPYDPTTDEMRQKTADIMKKLAASDASLPRSWRDFDWRGHWNFQRTLEQAGLVEADLGSDTVAVAVRATDGRFGVAISTGGTAITLRGRVGDVPILGAGLYAGERGAVAATGSGERIVRASLSRRVYEQLAAGKSLDDAVRWGIDEIGQGQYIGLIAITPDAMGASADRPMAWAAREAGSETWQGPEISGR